LVSVACSSFFSRTSSSLVVSYLVILPMALMGVYLASTKNLVLRNFFSVGMLPPLTLATWAIVIGAINYRLLRPPDVGSEGKEVVDEKEEQKYAIGVVIDRDLFPDKLFAPAKRTDLMPDGTNPVLDKEMRSEIFSQGTLMLRVVIQLSMLISIPLMAVCLFWQPLPGYYVCYVLTFNVLVGPVFSSGSITQERERQTLNLLLTTLLTPGRIIRAKLMASLRVSTVLTLLLTEQIMLAYALVRDLQLQFLTIIPFFLIILMTCLLTTSIGLLWSSLVRRTSVAMIMTYLSLMLIFVVPVGLYNWALTILPDVPESVLRWVMTPSPFAAAMSVPIVGDRLTATGADITAIEKPLAYANIQIWVIYLAMALLTSIFCHIVTLAAFRYRWWKARESV
ncbi:MAG: ABC transporter permease subunit, partial [Isosphaeraceae bacterium]